MKRADARILVGGFALALLPAGCGPKPTVSPAPIIEDVPTHVVIARVNQNVADLNFLVRAGGVSADAEFERDGRRESFHLNGTLLFERPRNLYIKLDHLLGTIEAGSNEDEFWFWEQLDGSRYTWGRHDGDLEDANARMPLRPDLLAEVLGLSNLPEDLGPTGPVSWVGSQFQEFIFMEHDDAGRLRIVKAVDVDRRPPYLIRSIVYFRPDGHPVMQAKLSHYRTIEGSDALAPHRLRIDWLPDRGWVELSFTDMKRFDKPEARQRFRSPRELGRELGAVTRVDQPRSPTSQPTLPPDAGVKTPTPEEN